MNEHYLLKYIKSLKYAQVCLWHFVLSWSTLYSALFNYRSQHLYIFSIFVCFMDNFYWEQCYFKIISYHASLLLRYLRLKRTQKLSNLQLVALQAGLLEHGTTAYCYAKLKDSKSVVLAISPFPLWLNIRSKTAFSSSFIVLLNITFQVLRPMSTVVHGLLKTYLSKTDITLVWWIRK